MKVLEDQIILVQDNYLRKSFFFENQASRFEKKNAFLKNNLTV